MGITRNAISSHALAMTQLKLSDHPASIHGIHSRATIGPPAGGPIVDALHVLTGQLSLHQQDNCKTGKHYKLFPIFTECWKCNLVWVFAACTHFRRRMGQVTRMHARPLTRGAYHCKAVILMCLLELSEQVKSGNNPTSETSSEWRTDNGPWSDGGSCLVLVLSYLLRKGDLDAWFIVFWMLCVLFKHKNILGRWCTIPQWLI